MSFNLTWDAAWETGLPAVDDGHRAMLDLCERIERMAALQAAAVPTGGCGGGGGGCGGSCGGGGGGGGGGANPQADKGAGADADSAAFESLIGQLKSLVRQHLRDESALLLQRGALDADDADVERAAFDELIDEVATPENFDAVERHRFVAVWCLGHVAESAGRLID